MPLRLVSLVLLLPVTFVNVYWASGLDRNVIYIASRSEGRCSMIGWLGPLGVVLPWMFLALAVGSAVQIIFRGKFGLSTVLLKLHVAHLVLLMGLLLLGNSFCKGAPIWPVVQTFWDLFGFLMVVMLPPVPVLVMQMAAMRTDERQRDSAL